VIAPVDPLLKYHNRMEVRHHLHENWKMNYGNVIQHLLAFSNKFFIFR
jgi:hypothetical protein